MKPKKLSNKAKLAKLIEGLREVIWEEDGPERNSLARDLLTEIGEAHGDEEREAERRRLFEADRPRREAELKARIERMKEVKERRERFFNHAFNELNLQKYEKAPMTPGIISQVEVEVNAALISYLKKTGEPDDIGRLVAQGDVITQNVYLKWKD